MKELKFRAWDGINKYIAYSESMNYDSRGIMYTCETNTDNGLTCLAQIIRPNDGFENSMWYLKDIM